MVFHCYQELPDSLRTLVPAGCFGNVFQCLQGTERKYELFHTSYLFYQLCMEQVTLKSLLSPEKNWKINSGLEINFI